MNNKVIALEGTEEQIKHVREFMTFVENITGTKMKEVTADYLGAKVFELIHGKNYENAN
jgi:hypothetical protein